RRDNRSRPAVRRHRTVPSADFAERPSHVFVAAVAGLNERVAQLEREDRYAVALDRFEIVCRHLVGRAQKVRATIETPRRDPTSIPGYVGQAIVRGNDEMCRRILGMRQTVERDHSVPFEISGESRGRVLAVEAGAIRYRADDMPSDISRIVAPNEIERRRREGAIGFDQLLSRARGGRAKSRRRRWPGSQSRKSQGERVISPQL